MDQQVGERLRKLREALGKTQKEVGEEIEIPHQSISSYERGYRKIPYETAEKLAKYYGVSTHYIYTGQEEADTTTYDLDKIFDNGKFFVVNGVAIPKEEIVSMMEAFREHLTLKAEKLNKN
jgi:transcriptional regulator with XRE-family HTH domain